MHYRPEFPERNFTQQEPEFPVEQKLRVVYMMRHATDEHLVAFLDRQAISWRDALHFFGNPQSKNITCQMPGNNHNKDVTEKYVCSDLNNSHNSQPPGPHTFCVDHWLEKCPIDKTDVKKSPV